MKKVLALILALGMSLSLAACGSGGSAAAGSAAAGGGEAIKVGVYGPLSGDAASVGQSEVDGVKLAVKQINDAGGVNGRPIELVVEDDAQDPATAVSAVNKLVYSDKVTAVIGTVNSSCTLASMEVTKKAKVPHITPISSGAAVTESGNDYIIRIQASDLLQAGGIAKYAVETLGAKKIGCLYQSDDYGTGAMEVIVDTLKGYNMELAANEAFDASAVDVTSQLLNVKNAGCDALIMYTMYQQGALISKQARQMGMDIPLMGGGGLTNAKLYTLGGDAVVGLVNTQTFFANSDAVNQVSADFIKAFEAEYGKTPDSNNAMSYDSVLALVEGLKYAGDDLSGDKIMEGMKQIKNMDMATGCITIAENGDAIRDSILYVRLVGDKQYELVK